MFFATKIIIFLHFIDLPIGLSFSMIRNTLKLGIFDVLFDVFVWKNGVLCIIFDQHKVNFATITIKLPMVCPISMNCIGWKNVPKSITKIEYFLHNNLLKWWTLRIICNIICLRSRGSKKIEFCSKWTKNLLRIRHCFYLIWRQKSWKN